MASSSSAPNAHATGMAGEAESSNPWKRRVTDHRHDTPEERSAAVAAALSQYLTSLFGYDTCMLTGNDDSVDKIHCLPRSLQVKHPELFLAIKTYLGKRFYDKDGNEQRGLNLDTSSNQDNLDPTSHRDFDLFCLWALLYEDWRWLADEIHKKDGRSWDEICPGQIFKYRPFVFNKRRLFKAVSEHPSRSSVPKPAAQSRMANESSEDLPPDVAANTPDPQTQRRGNRPPPPFLGTPYTVDISTGEPVIYSIINPVFALINLMMKLRSKLDDIGNWPDEQVEMYLYLEPRLRHLFDTNDCVVGGKIVTDAQAQSNPKGLRPRKPKAPTTPDATANVRTGRGKAKEKMAAKTAAPAVTTRRTRSQTAAEVARTSKPATTNTTTNTKTTTTTTTTTAKTTTRATRSITKSSIPQPSVKPQKSTTADAKGKTTRATKSAKSSQAVQSVKPQKSTTNAGPSKIPQPTVGEKRVRKIGAARHYVHEKE